MADPATAGLPPGQPAGSPPEEAARLDCLLDRLEELLAEVESFEAPVRGSVFELLDGIDALHRFAITRLAAALGDVTALRREEPAVDWLFEAYGVGVDDVAAADAALAPVRPYLYQHGGDVAVLSVSGGVVRVRLSGACAGCTSAAVTLRDGVEEALREGLAGFVAMEVESDDAAAPHAPPAVLLQISPRPGRS